jgi:NAD(P)-dependent dehydrogenase (short-subunit alcohol dehydrogenase family)
VSEAPEERLRFDGRVAIVTGAGRGIGRSHALLLASRGAAVVVNDLGTDVYGFGLSDDPAGCVVGEIVESGGKAVASYEDVASPEGAATIVRQALEAFGRLDVVVNNAGFLDRAAFPEVDRDELYRQLDVHLGGSFNVTRAAWPHLVETRAGRVVLTTSPLGLYGGATSTAYGAAKGAVAALTRCLADVGREEGVNVNAISPGAFSRMTEVGGSNDALRQFTARHRTAENISPLVALLSHERCATTGEIFAVSGGRVARILVAETPGFVKPDHSPEELLASWSEVVDQSGYVVPTTTAESLAFGRDQLRRAGIDVPAFDDNAYSWGRNS